MKKKLLSYLTVFFAYGSAVSADNSSVVTEMNESVLMGGAGNIGQMNIAPMVPMIGNPFFDTDNSSSNSANVNEPVVSNPGKDPFAFVFTNDKNQPDATFQKLQGTWLVKSSNSYLFIIFSGNNFTMKSGLLSVSGTWQHRDNTITLFANNNYESHNFTIDGNRLIIDNGTTVFEKQDAPNTVFTNPSPVTEPVATPSVANLEGRWDTMLKQGKFTFMFEGNNYRSFLNDLQVGGGTFFLDGNKLNYNENFGQNKGETGIDIISLNGNNLSITFTNNQTYTFAKDVNFSFQKFSQQQVNGLKGRWVFYGSTASKYIVFTFIDGIFTMYENGNRVDQARYEASGSEIKLKWLTGKTKGMEDSWSFTVSGNVLLLIMPNVSGPFRMVRG